MNESEKFLIERLRTASPEERIHMSEYLLRAGKINIILSAGGEQLLQKVRAAMKNHEYMVMGDTGMETIDSNRKISFK